MGTGQNESGSSAAEFEAVMVGLSETLANASYEDVFSFVPIVESFSRLSVDSVITCSGNWDRQLAFRAMERESCLLAVWSLWDLCYGH